MKKGEAQNERAAKPLSFLAMMRYLSQRRGLEAIMINDTTDSSSKSTGTKKRKPDEVIDTGDSVSSDFAGSDGDRMRSSLTGSDGDRR